MDKVIRSSEFYRYLSFQPYFKDQGLEYKGNNIYLTKIKNSGLCISRLFFLRCLMGFVRNEKG